MLLRILRLCWPPAWTQHDLEVACSLMAVLTFCGMAAILYMRKYMCQLGVCVLLKAPSNLNICSDGTPQDKDPDLDLSEQHRDKLIQDLLKAKGWKVLRLRYPDSPVYTTQYTTCCSWCGKMTCMMRSTWSSQATTQMR